MSTRRSPTKSKKSPSKVRFQEPIDHMLNQDIVIGLVEKYLKTKKVSAEPRTIYHVVHHLFKN